MTNPRFVGTFLREWMRVHRLDDVEIEFMPITATVSFLSPDGQRCRLDYTRIPRDRHAAADWLDERLTALFFPPGEPWQLYSLPP